MTRLSIRVSILWLIISLHSVALKNKERFVVLMKRLAEEVYVINEPIAHFGPSDMQFLKETVYKTQRKRVRICMHKDIQEKLHEMFVCYVKETYVRPNKHIKKDESLHIM